MTKTYLVTGGAGFIGANLVRHLAAPGIQIRVLDNLSAGRLSDLADLPVQFLKGDIRDAVAMNLAIRGLLALSSLVAHCHPKPPLGWLDFLSPNDYQNKYD